MDDSDDDSSSGSSSDFARGYTHRDELTASFFSIKSTAKSDPANSKNGSENGSDEDSDDDNFTSVPESNGIELFSEVVKNLEATQKISENSEQHNSQDTGSQCVKKAKFEEKKNNISDEINAVLLQGEGEAFTLHRDDKDTDNEEEEDVKPPAEYTIPKEGINITLPGSCVLLNKKKTGKKESNLTLILRRKLKANQILVEKVGRLCWLAHGFHLNRQANDPEIMATVVSLVSASNYPKDKFDLAYLAKFTKWFRNTFTIETNDNVTIDKETLLKKIAEKKVSNYRELVVLYVAVIRGIGLNCRLIVSLYPPTAKAYNDQPPKASTVKKTDKIKEEPKETKVEVKSSKENTKAKSSKEDTKAKSSKEDTKAKSSKEGTKVKSSKEDAKVKSSKKDTRAKSSKKDKDTDSKIIPNSSIIQNSESARRDANLVAKKRAVEILRSKYAYVKKNGDKVTDNASVQKNTEVKDDEAASTSGKKADAVISPRRLRSGRRNTASALNKGQSSAPTSSGNNSSRAKNRARRKSDSNDSDSSLEEEEEEDEIKVPSKAKKKRSDGKAQTTKSRGKKEKVDQESTDEEETDEKVKKRQDVWAEVYVESKGSWISINVMDGNVDCVAEVYKKASKPVLYVIAFNSERLIKDVTRRYCSHWLSVTRKQRVDEKWWAETLSYWPERETAISRQEDDLLLQRELEQPLPKTVGECKGHPLYVLVRHLLKYEALYPPDCVPLGHLPNGEAIYSRYCVYTLCSRETWLKKARVVKPKQEAYKIVKALPKYDKLSGMKLKDSALELFGEWQTTDYVPPEAKDGIVPRNEYGNVDLFKQCMLPKGTVHINLPGLNRIARKLNIDCASAVVGFNFGCMGAVPAIEGFVVCAEYEDTLREAWEAEQFEASKRAAEKREKRIYGNWRKLIKGLLIREKLSQKYEFLAESSKADQSSKRAKQRKTPVKKFKV